MLLECETPLVAVSGIITQIHKGVFCGSLVQHSGMFERPSGCAGKGVLGAHGGLNYKYDIRFHAQGMHTNNLTDKLACHELFGCTRDFTCLILLFRLLVTGLTFCLKTFWC